ncbi:MAG: InlB B-repeat-containing protein [Treponema sp.]|jgi:uncharacterized repeat protein (TIGR02543 family)|nr:InlB B-repeat-containing protein [Treponema sp.]
MNKKTLRMSAILSLFSLVLSLLMLFIACDMTAPEPEQASAHEGKAAVRVVIETAAGRTVSPTAALEDTSAWELWGGKQGAGETLLKEFSSDQGFTVYLNDTGTWSFTLKGYKDNELILSGTIGEQTISLTETNTLTFAVKPVLEGDGAINLVIELPPDTGITEARVFKDGEEAGSITPADDKLVLNGDYPAGTYRFVIKLYNDSRLYGAISEAVHVWAHLTSAKTYTLTVEDLNLTYLITYHFGEGETETSSYRSTDAALTLLTAPSREGYVFMGWYEHADFSGATIGAIPAGSTGHKEFFARWAAITPAPSSSLADSLAWISANAEDGGAYTITLNAEETIAPTAFNYEGKKVNVILTGGDTEHTISLSSNGSSFTVESNVILTLGNNITLQGRSNNTASLVKVNSGGALVMETGSKISGNTASASNAYSYGGGVFVSSNGTFTMRGGAISGNTASSTNASYGGGVFVSSNGTFTMSGGEISGNTASASNSSYGVYSYGGGVYVSDSGTFTMSGGAISGNTASYGGGVYVYSSATFTMSGGEISGNTASTYSNSSYGGGVFVSGGTFTMSGGAISGNTATTTSSYYYSSASSKGGGVFVSSGTFTMRGGAISGNTASSTNASASSYGGGVYVDSGTFTKESGGIIYGSNAESGLKNTASNGGHAVYVDSSPGKKRNTTAGEGVTLDSAQDGDAGGWE